MNGFLEFAVLKALGFSDNKLVLSLVVAESVHCCVYWPRRPAACSYRNSSSLSRAARCQTSSCYYKMPWTDNAAARTWVLASIVALLSSLLPALRVKQLNVVDALVKR